MRFDSLMSVVLGAAFLLPARLVLAGAVNPAANTGLCLDVAWGNSANGTAVQLANCTGDQAQNWSFTSSGQIQVFGTKCLDVTNGNNQDGTALQIWDCNAGNNNQQFTLNGGSIVWIAGGKCVDIPQGNITDGQHLQIWDCNGSSAQQWQGISFPTGGGSGGGGSSGGGATTSSASFTGQIKSVINGGLCLDIAGGGNTDGSAIQVADCSSNPAQVWTYNGSSLSANGKCLDVPGATDQQGERVQLWDCNGSRAQQWSVRGSTLVWEGGQNKCLDIPGSNATDGQQLHIWGCNGTNAQNWSFPNGTGGGGGTGGGTGTGWNLVWSDEFNGNGLDTSKWNVEVNCSGGGNNEQECYVNSSQNIYVSNGVLTIKVIKQNYNGKPYTSGRINTSNKAMWTYGRFETRLKVPCGQGFWPAAWMLPNDSVYGTWPTSGELDIMEILGGNPSELFGTAHYGPAWPNQKQSGGTYTMQGGNFCGDFHVFAIEWLPDHVTWSVDGTNYYTLTSNGANWSPLSHWPFDQRFFFILNVAMGGDWPGAPDPSIQGGSMQVDYVRAYTHQ